MSKIVGIVFGLVGIAGGIWVLLWGWKNFRKAA